MNKIDKLKKFLQTNYPQIQAFDTPSLAGDYRVKVYNKDGIQVYYAPNYDYVEIYGLTKDEFRSLLDKKRGYNIMKKFDIGDKEND